MMTSRIFFSPDKPQFLPVKTTNTTIVFFLHVEYRIMLAIDCCTALTFRFLAVSWWKIHSHVIEFLSVIFARFHVRLYIPWVSSYGGVWSLYSLYTDIVLFFFSFFSKTLASSRAKRACESERAVYISSCVLDSLWRENRGSVNRLKSPGFVLYLHIGETWSFCCAARDWKSPPERRNVTKYFRQRSWFGKKFVPQIVYLSSEVNKSRAFIWVITQHFIAKGLLTSTEIWMKLFTRRRILSAEM